MAKPKMVTVAGRLETVEAYMLARVAPDAGHQIACSAAFEYYRTWCAAEGLAPLREAAFVIALEEIARAAGIPLRQRGSNLSFMDVPTPDELHDAGCGVALPQIPRPPATSIVTPVM